MRMPWSLIHLAFVPFLGSIVVSSNPAVKSSLRRLCVSSPHHTSSYVNMIQVVLDASMKYNDFDSLECTVQTSSLNVFLVGLVPQCNTMNSTLGSDMICDYSTTRARLTESCTSGGGIMHETNYKMTCTPGSTIACGETRHDEFNNVAFCLGPSCTSDQVTKFINLMGDSLAMEHATGWSCVASPSTKNPSSAGVRSGQLVGTITLGAILLTGLGI